MKTCVKCGAQLSDDAKFCNKCGEKLEENAQEIKLTQAEEIEEEGTVLLDDVQVTESETAKEEAPEESAAEIPEEVVEEAVQETVEETVEEVVEESSEESVEEYLTEQPDEQPEQLLAEAEKALESAFGEVQEPVKEIKLAPAVSPEVEAAIAASNAKAAKKAEKIARDAEKKAEKIAKNAEKKASKKGANQIEEKPNTCGKITFFGVVAAILLSLFLVLNLGVIFASSFSAGISLSEIEKAQFVVDGEIYSIDGFVQMASSFDDGEMMSFLEALAYSDRTLDVALDGTVYSIELSQESVDMIEEVIEEGKGFANGVIEAIGDVKEISFVVSVSLLGYSAAVSLICVIAIIACLGKRRKAAILPAVILAVFGITMLVASLICTLVPIPFGIQAVDAIFSLSPVALFANLSAGAVALVGIVLFVIGVTGKKKA